MSIYSIQLRFLTVKVDFKTMANSSGNKVGVLETGTTHIHCFCQNLITQIIQKTQKCLDSKYRSIKKYFVLRKIY